MKLSLLSFIILNETLHHLRHRSQQDDPRRQNQAMSTWTQTFQTHLRSTLLHQGLPVLKNQVRSTDPRKKSHNTYLSHVTSCHARRSFPSKVCRVIYALSRHASHILTCKVRYVLHVISCMFSHAGRVMKTPSPFDNCFSEKKTLNNLANGKILM